MVAGRGGGGYRVPILVTLPGNSPVNGAYPAGDWCWGRGVPVLGHGRGGRGRGGPGSVTRRGRGGCGVPILVNLPGN